MTTKGPLLPTGAIGIAAPHDVLQAAKICRARTTALPTLKKKITRPDDINPRVRSAHRDEAKQATGASTMSQASLQKSSAREASADRTTNKYSRARADGHGRRNTLPSNRKANSRLVADDQNVVDVPMNIIDTRSQVERFIDELIDERPDLRDLEAFEEGSVLDYVDMIGLTREEVFKDFPSTKPDLPSVPGCKALELSFDLPEDEDEMLPLLADIETGPRLCGRRDLLAEALALECRRADLLAYQVTMLRAELVITLKRWKVMSSAVLPALNCHCSSDEQRYQEYQQRLCSLDGMAALNTGKLVHVQAGEAEVLHTFRHRNRKPTETRVGTFDYSREESCSSSAETISIWSSSSEENDE